jgi:hypothetical protein
MTCPTCKQERGCGCTFKPHPVTNESVCSTCYTNAVEELEAKKKEDNAIKPPESTN